MPPTRWPPQAHGTQRRDNGDPYITHPVAVADILAGYRLDTASIATGLLHDVIEDTPVKLPDIQTPVRRRDRRPGRRRHQADPARAAVRPHQAGGEFPQAGAGDQPRHPRAAGEARRPAAQHAHAAFRAGRRAPPPHRARDDGDLRAARRTDRHGRGEDRAADAGLRAARSGGLRHHPGAAELPARPGRRRDRGGARGARSASATSRRDGDRGRGAREVALLDLGEDAPAQRRVRAALRHHGVPHRRADARRPATRRWARCTRRIR